MTRRYDRQLKVLPFIIVPSAITDQESALAFWPKKLVGKTDELIRRLYAPISAKNLNCPVIAQVFFYGGEILIASVIQTQVPDAKSGRFGLKLTYGALVSRDVLFYHPNVCAKVSEFMDRYFQSEFGVTVSIRGADEIVAKFQRDQRMEDLISQDKTNELLNRFESEFCLTDRAPLNLVDKVRLHLTSIKLKRYRRIKPANTTFETRGFWRKVDDDLFMGRKAEAQMIQPSTASQQPTSVQPTLQYQSLFDAVQSTASSAWNTSCLVWLLFLAQVVTGLAMGIWGHEIVHSIQVWMAVYIVAVLLDVLVALRLIELLLHLSALFKLVSSQCRSGRKSPLMPNVRLILAGVVLVVTLVMTIILLIVTTGQLLPSV
jgi:hypothetical protein